MNNANILEALLKNSQAPQQQQQNSQQLQQQLQQLLAQQQQQLREAAAYAAVQAMQQQQQPLNSQYAPAVGQQTVLTPNPFALHRLSGMVDNSQLSHELQQGAAGLRLQIPQQQKQYGSPSNMAALHGEHQHEYEVTKVKHSGTPKRKINFACTECRKAHKGCDGARPCSRCKKLGIEDRCKSTVRKKNRVLANKYWKSIMNASSHSSPASGAATPTSEGSSPVTLHNPNANQFLGEHSILNPGQMIHSAGSSATSSPILQPEFFQKTSPTNMSSSSSSAAPNANVAASILHTTLNALNQISGQEKKKSPKQSSASSGSSSARASPTMQQLSANVSGLRLNSVGSVESGGSSPASSPLPATSTSPCAAASMNQTTSPNNLAQMALMNNIYKQLQQNPPQQQQQQAQLPQQAQQSKQEQDSYTKLYNTYFQYFYNSIRQEQLKQAQNGAANAVLQQQQQLAAQQQAQQLAQQQAHMIRQQQLQLSLQQLQLEQLNKDNAGQRKQSISDLDTNMMETGVPQESPTGEHCILGEFLALNDNAHGLDTFSFSATSPNSSNDPMNFLSSLNQPGDEFDKLITDEMQIPIQQEGMQVAAGKVHQSEQSQP